MKDVYAIGDRRFFVTRYYTSGWTGIVEAAQAKIYPGMVDKKWGEREPTWWYAFVIDTAGDQISDSVQAPSKRKLLRDLQSTGEAGPRWERGSLRAKAAS